MNDIAVAIFKFLVMAVSEYYEPINIQQAFQSNVVTNVTDYVEITQLSTLRSTYYPQASLNSATSVKTIGNLRVTQWQIDFFGANANAAVNVFELMLTGNGNEWFTGNGHPYSIARCEQWQNLTEVIDSSSYIPRFCIRFSLYSNSEVSITVPTFDHISVGVENVDLIL